NTSSKSQGIYPHDYIDLATRKKGAVLLHVFGMLYMFVALAIVCDEFFVPALEVITRRLKISDDVAGATFMAAGGSAPELFTSIIGVFLAKSNVGIGNITYIIYTSIYNILNFIFVCYIFIAPIPYWLRYKNISFKIFIQFRTIITLYLINTNLIQESIGLMIIYGLYVTFMKFNKPIETWVKKKIGASTLLKIIFSEKQFQILLHPKPNIADNKHCLETRGFNYKQLNNSKSLFDILPTVQFKQACNILCSKVPINVKPIKNLAQPNPYAMFKTKPLFPRMARTLNKRGSTDRDVINSIGKNTLFLLLMIGNYAKLCDEVFPDVKNIKIDVKNIKINTQNNHPSNGAADNSRKIWIPNLTMRITIVTGSDVIDENGFKIIAERKHSGIPPNEEVEMSDMLDLSWPETNAKRCIYLAIAPIMYALWITLPDVRNPKREKWFMFSFFGSILWIAGFSYLMVWWAHQVGETIGFSEAVMGLTFLAAGTSVPDLITSVIVARKGLGDMAVSSSVGSNIFDVTIGLPFPWFVSSLALHGGSPIAVESKGLFCSILLLFAMLLFVVISIAVCKWKMSKRLGITMLLLYVVFLVLSLLLEFTVIQCPVTT
uniref:Sodium/calcium exchanger membrane region domain-containing protein n=1 Tax=Ciona intestinalis TaxID=7719 RepID=H2Y2I8_CIOIN